MCRLKEIIDKLSLYSGTIKDFIVKKKFYYHRVKLADKRHIYTKFKKKTKMLKVIAMMPEEI